MDDTPGIELSILEGMDEALLAQLHRAGIHTRAELEKRLATRDGRRTLSRDAGIASRRLEVLYHLNFLLPEEQVERTLAIERRFLDRCEHVNQEIRQVWRAMTGVAIAVLAGLLLAFVFLRPSGKPSPREEADARRLSELEERVAALAPVGIRHAEARTLSGVAELGPAPGWNGPLSWTPEIHREVQTLLGTGEETLPCRAVSLALLRLADLENASNDTLTWADRARAAADLVRGFPVVRAPATPWDRAAVLLRTRCRSRSLGLAPLDRESPNVMSAAGWSWTDPGFLTSEEMLSRLEALPLTQEALPVWSESLIQIRSAADAARDNLGDTDAAFARDVWIRRAELEAAVVAAILGNGNLLPYHRQSPRDFLRQRRGFLESAIDRAPSRARGSLEWLAVEYEEADRLLDWLENAGDAARGPYSSWMAAMLGIEELRMASGLAPGPEVERRIRERLPENADPWTSATVRWEAGLRPLLMETRGGIRRARGVSP